MPIAEKCTKTSSPPSRSMKPKPFSFENHFTVPSANCVPPCKNTDGTSRRPMMNPPDCNSRYAGNKASASPCRGDRVLQNHGNRHGADAAGNGRHIRRKLPRVRVDVAEKAVIGAVHADVDHGRAGLHHVGTDDVEVPDRGDQNVRAEGVTLEVDRP